MLSDIINRKLPSRCVLIQDSIEQSGQPLLEAFIQRAVDEDRNICIFCFETPVTEIQKSIKGVDRERIQFYDCFYDHRNWLHCCGKRSGNTEILEMDSKCLQRATLPESDSQIVFIDSLSPLLCGTDLCSCYAQLHALCNSGQVVCLVHEDVLLDARTTLAGLRHLATTCVRVLPPSPASRGGPVAEVRHLKPGGGVLRQEVTSEKIQSGSGSSVGTRLPDSSQLPPDLTTFKIDLKQGEKQARSKLVLPYIRPSAESTDVGGGKVFYQPDAADDWDEEDPDDDLDI
ncbi:elongator complex protein 5 isoform X2 [Bacillus rossius redtenbacheri]|uniref:elongator complex protein 5 isoform X2 n=1 Tax=Bacillus rossius redtenbacheri TaxID=93214 RepID=UPI002FDDF983